MKVLGVFAFVVLAVQCSATRDLFQEWAASHHKIYTVTEARQRSAIFTHNLATIQRLNHISTGAHFAPGPFADLTHEEFAATHTTDLMFKDKTVAKIDMPDLSAADEDDEVDYRSWLPAVKDQGQCGSCWAFSAVANMEGQTYKKTGKVVSLSEQQLVSCDWVLNMGCNGGNCLFADMYAIEFGMTSEELYPYTSGNGSSGHCLNHSEVVATFRTAHQFIGLKDATLMAHLKEYGPLSIAIEADKDCFQHYTSGVLDSDECKCGYWVNHGVTLVGYGTDAPSGKQYWLVRNSWSDEWGEKGYVRLARGKNMCQINQRPSSIEA